MLMESVTVLLHRLGRGLRGDHEPGVPGAAQPDGELHGIRAETPTATLRRYRRGLDPRPARRRPSTARSLGGGRAPAAERARRRPAGGARLRGDERPRCTAWPDELDTDHDGQFPGCGPPGCRRSCCAGWPTGTSCCLATNAARCPTADAAVDESSRLGVLRRRARRACPQLTDADELLVLAQATVPSYLRYGAYPYVVVRPRRRRQATRSSTGSSGCSPSPR